MKKVKQILSILLVCCLLAGAVPLTAQAAASDTTGWVQTTSANTDGNHSLAVKSDGTLWAWGNNEYGQLGYATNNAGNASSKPTQVMSGVVSVSSGYGRSYAIKEDGSLWGWGYNAYGSLGDGTNTSRKNPVKIMEDVAMVSGGGFDSLAVKTDGTLWTWGRNITGGLGNGSYKSNPSPVKIMDHVVAAESGNTYAFAIKTDGSLWGWGNNGGGQLGLEEVANYTSPVKIMDDVAAVSAGVTHSLIIKTDGTLWACGKNSSGEIGDGTKEKRFDPIKIMDDVVAVSAGKEHSLAIKSDGSLWGWGDNSFGELGNSDVGRYLSPIKIMDDVAAVSAGELHTIVMKTDGTLWAFGYNGSGQLGYKSVKWWCSTPEKILDSVANTAIVVEDTISDETILRAKKLTVDHSFDFYREWESPVQIMAKQLDPYSATTWYTVEKLFDMYYKSLKDDGVLPSDVGEITSVEFYEYLLYKLLDSPEMKYYSVTEPFGLIEDLSDGKVNTALMKKLVSAGFKAGTKITNEDLSKLKSACQQICGEDEVHSLADLGWMDAILVPGKIIDDYATEYVKLYALTKVSDVRAEAIRMIGENTQLPALRTAAENVYSSVQKAKTEGIAYCVSGGVANSMDGITKMFLEKLAGEIYKLHPMSALWKKVVDTTTLGMDAVFHTNDIATDTIYILGMANVEKALLKAVDRAETSFLNNQTLENAQRLIALADTLKQGILVDCDLVIRMVDHCERGSLNLYGLWQLLSMQWSGNTDDVATVLKKWISGDENSTYAQMRRSLTSIKSTVKLSDFYAGSVSVLELLREVKSTTPSTWASTEVEKAVQYGILPDVMQNNYQNNITRIEFCALLECMIEEKTGKTILELADEFDLIQVKPPFDDALYTEANNIALLGIINGVGNNQFNPLGEITRQEAATMLYRTADVLGYNTTSDTFDHSGVADWATAGVDFVTTYSIMNGTGNGFDPAGKYTKEQAILTMVRFFVQVK